jgi:hypothetical protein
VSGIFTVGYVAHYASAQNARHARRKAMRRCFAISMPLSEGLRFSLASSVAVPAPRAGCCWSLSKMQRCGSQQHMRHTLHRTQHVVPANGHGVVSSGGECAALSSLRHALSAATTKHTRSPLPKQHSETVSLKKQATDEHMVATERGTLLAVCVRVWDHHLASWSDDVPLKYPDAMAAQGGLKPLRCTKAKPRLMAAKLASLRLELSNF